MVNSAPFSRCLAGGNSASVSGILEQQQCEAPPSSRWRLSPETGTENMQTCLHSRTLCLYLFSFLSNQSWRARDWHPSLSSVPKMVKSSPWRHCSRAEPPSPADLFFPPCLSFRLVRLIPSRALLRAQKQWTGRGPALLLRPLVFACAF